MQTILGYGFLLDAPGNYPENEYQEIKNSIEKICRFAEYHCKAIKQNNLNFALRAGEKMFITVSVHNGQAEFALLDRKNNCLIQKCSIVMLKRYVDQSKMDLLAYRIENECNAIEKGSVLNRASLDYIWNAKYGEEEKQKKKKIDGIEEQVIFKTRGKGR